MKIILIAAISKNGIIGRTSGEMPWHSKEEFKHFRRTTLGSPVIMGRKTFDSLGEPLKGRLNIVLTQNKNYECAFEEVKVLNSLDEAYGFCKEAGSENIFVIGGGYIFEKAVKDADAMILSRMDFDAEGDVYFPVIDDSVWEVERAEKGEGFEVFYYKRKGKN